MTTSRRLLLIEDDPDLRITLEHFLGKIGYGVIAVTSAEEGMASCAEERPNAILLDIVLPGMDGYEFCREVKSGSIHRSGICVIFLTGKPEEEVRTKGAKVGADYYITKPTDPTDVGADLYAMFEQDFTMSEADMRMLRVVKRIPEDPTPEESYVPSEPTHTADPHAADSHAAVEPAPARDSSSSSSMELDQVQELLQALKGSLVSTRDSLNAVVDYIDRSGH